MQNNQKKCTPNSKLGKDINLGKMKTSFLFACFLQDDRKFLDLKTRKHFRNIPA